MGPMSRSSRSSSRARAVGVMPSAISGRLGGHGHVGLDLEIAAERLDRGLQPKLDLGFVELGPAGLLAGLLEATLGVGALVAQLVEPGGGGPLGLALQAAPLAQLPELALDGGEPVGDQRRELVDRALLGVELDATNLGLAARLHRPVETSLHLGEAGAQELPAVGEPGRAHLEVGSERAHRSSPLLEVGLAAAIALACSAVSASSASRSGRVSSSSCTRACSRASRSPSSSGVGAQRIGLGGGVATVGVDALQTVGGGGEAAVVLVELTGERGLRLAGLVEQRARAVEARLGVVGRGGGGVGPLAGLLQRRAGGTGRGGADPPARGAEAPAGAGDDDRVGVGEGGVDRRRPATVHGHGPAEERVEQRLHVRSTGPDVRADRLADGRCRRRRAVSAEGQDRAADGVVAFGVEGADRRPGRVDAVDHDRRERLARGRLDGRLPAGVDLDEVEQGADDPSTDASRSAPARARAWSRARLRASARAVHA